MTVGIFVGYAVDIPFKISYIGFFVFAIASLGAWVLEKRVEKGVTFIFICLGVLFLGITLMQGEKQNLLIQARALGLEFPGGQDKTGAKNQYLTVRGIICAFPEERNVYPAERGGEEEDEVEAASEENAISDKVPETSARIIMKKISFPLKIEEVKKKDGWEKADGKIQVNVYEPEEIASPFDKLKARNDTSHTGAKDFGPPLSANDARTKFRIGDRLEINGHLQPLPASRNPGDFDYGAYLMRQGIVGQMSPVRDKTPKASARISNWVSINTKSEEKSVLGERRSGSERKGGGRRYGEVKNGMGNGVCPHFRILSRNNINFITRIAARGRDYMEKIIDLGPYDNGRDALLKAMLIGKRENLDEGMKENYINTGTIHIMAISGLHLVIVMAIILFLCRIISLPQRFASIACIVFLIIYAFLTGGRTSVWRAAIMSGLYLGSRFFNRQVDKWTTFSMAGLIILFISPQALFDSGFQLTFMAVGGLMYFYPRLEHVLRERGKGLFRRTVSRYLVKSILTILAAQIALGPFLIYYYYRFPMSAFIANLAIVPLLGIVTALGFVSSLTGLISLSLARAFNATNNIFLLIMDKVTSFLSALPGQVIYLPKLSPLFFLVYYGILFLLFYPVRLKPVDPIIVSPESPTGDSVTELQRGVRKF